MVLEWLAGVIAGESDVSVCGSATSLTAAMPLLAKTRPALVIVDIFLKDSRGANAVAALREQSKDLQILVFSRLPAEPHAEIAIRGGARGFVTHCASGCDVATAIRRVLTGGIYLGEQIADRILIRMADGQSAGMRSLDQLLSMRELCVFELLGDGYRPSEIAGKMNLRISTVESYIGRIQVKLCVDTSRELVRQAIIWMRERNCS